MSAFATSSGPPLALHRRAMDAARCGRRDGDDAPGSDARIHIIERSHRIDRAPVVKMMDAKKESDFQSVLKFPPITNGIDATNVLMPFARH